MPKSKYALEPGGEKSLEISYGTFWKNFEVRLDGNLIVAIPNKKELETGRIFQLPDGSTRERHLVPLRSACSNSSGPSGRPDGLRG